MLGESGGLPQLGLEVASRNNVQTRALGFEITKGEKHERTRYEQANPDYQ
jgi:hypothetical protein